MNQIIIFTALKDHINSDVWEILKTSVASVDNSIVRKEEIWSLDIYVGNTKKYKLSYNL